MRIRLLRAILPPTSTLDEPAIVVDTLLHSLVLPAVVDNERLTAPTATVTHGYGRGEDRHFMLEVTARNGCIDEHRATRDQRSIQSHTNL